jgi:hypothetical protein
VIVVDTSPFFHGPMLATLDRTDELLLLCSLDVPTLKNVRLACRRSSCSRSRTGSGRPQPRELEGRHEAKRGRGGARDEGALRGAERPRRPARRQRGATRSCSPSPEITDDILGYGSRSSRSSRDDPRLRARSSTESHGQRPDQIYVERAASSSDDVAFVDDAHLMRIIDKIVSQVGRRVDESSPMVDARLPDGSAASTRSSRRSRSRPDADDPEVLARPVHDRRPDRVRHALAEAAQFLAPASRAS